MQNGCEAMADSLLVSQLEAALEGSQVHNLMAAYLVVLSSAVHNSGCGHTQSPALL